MGIIDLKFLSDNDDKKIKKKLIDVINKNNIFIESDCGGQGSCGKCKVKIIKGKVSEITDIEKKILTKYEIEDNIVLSCKRYIYDDVSIELLDNNRKHMEKGEIIKGNSEIEPIVEKIYLELPLPTLNDQRSDVLRITDFLKEKKQVEYEIDVNLIGCLGEILQKSNYKVTVTIFNKEIIKIQEENQQIYNYGIALDIGTTTVAAYLIDLSNGMVIDSKSSLNFQKKYGADVISRINYSIQNETNKITLQQEITSTIDNIIGDIIINNNIDKENISIVSIVGNTTMSHLLIGASVKGISKSPFNPVFSKSIIEKTKLLNIHSLDDKTRFILLPNIGGYVGSDTLGAIISSNMETLKGNTLLIDVGTNCELALKTDNKILVCSTAAGPTFEGANMECGMRASEGAICSCEINLNDDIKVRVIDNNKINTQPIGICGSGYINIISKLIDNKLILPTGRIVKPENLNHISQEIKSRIQKQGKSYEIIFSNNKIDSKNKKVSICQQDISNLQLAKGAVKAAIELLMQEANIDKLDNIFLAGAFGSNLDIKSMKNIKMIPNIEDEKIKIIGNAAGSGAIQIILHKDKYDTMNNLSQTIIHVELANHKDFNKVFTNSLML